jgi:hypothetical protein
VKPKLITNFNRLNEIEYQTLVSLIIAALTGNLRFPLPWPAPAPSLEELIAAFEAYCRAYRAALTGDSVLIAARNAARATLTDLLQRLAAYLEFAAHGDEVALQTTGFELRRPPVRLNNNEPLAAPDAIRLQRGAFSGELDLRFSRLIGAGSYEVQIAVGDPGVESNWRQALISTTCTGITLRDLAPLQICWVRVRGIIGQRFGYWSAPVSIMVL